MEVTRIASFEVDHNVLKPGLYISRVDGDITTYDIRTRVPNQPDLMDNSTMHTCEHMLATYFRNSEIKDDVIYFGAMGCQTGFYLLVRNADHHKVLEVLRACVDKTIHHEGAVFGNSAKECGNYRTLNLSMAQAECRRYAKVLENVDAENLNY